MLCTLLVLGGAAVLHAAPQHPHLLVNAGDLEQLRMKLKSEPWRARLLDEVKKDADGGNPVAAAVVYAIAGDRACGAKALAHLLQQAKDFVPGRPGRGLSLGARGRQCHRLRPGVAAAFGRPTAGRDGFPAATGAGCHQVPRGPAADAQHVVRLPLANRPDRLRDRRPADHRVGGQRPRAAVGWQAAGPLGRLQAADRTGTDRRGFLGRSHDLRQLQHPGHDVPGRGRPAARRHRPVQLQQSQRRQPAEGDCRARFAGLSHRADRRGRRFRPHGHLGRRFDRPAQPRQQRVGRRLLRQQAQHLSRAAEPLPHPRDRLPRLERPAVCLPAGAQSPPRRAARAGSSTCPSRC